MNKLVFPILITLMAITFWSGAKAETIFSDVDTMSVADAYGLPGDTVEVSVIMSNTRTIEAIFHRIVYDSTLLEIDTIYCVDRGCNPQYFDSDY